MKTTEAGHVPPKAVQAAAERGLKLRKEHGRGGTEVGVARARDLSNGAAVSDRTIGRMVSFFARHADNRNPDDPSSAGQIAWLLWGGDPGRDWANRVWDKIKESPGASSSEATFTSYLEAVNSSGGIKDGDAFYEAVNSGPDYSGGTMVCWRPPVELAANLAVPDGLPASDLHVTLCFIPEVGDPVALRDAVASWASQEWATFGRLSGTGRFVQEKGDVFYLSVDVPGLETLRTRLANVLEAAGSPPSNSHGYVPHMTIAYLDSEDDFPDYEFSPVEIAVDSVVLVMGPEEHKWPLTGAKPDTVKFGEGISVFAVNDPDPEAVRRLAESTGEPLVASWYERAGVRTWRLFGEGASEIAESFGGTGSGSEGEFSESTGTILKLFERGTNFVEVAASRLFGGSVIESVAIVANENGRWTIREADPSED